MSGADGEKVSARLDARVHDGGSVKGSLEELVAFWLSLASNSAIRFSREVMTAKAAAWASGGMVFQSDSGIEG